MNEIERGFFALLVMSASGWNAYTGRYDKIGLGIAPIETLKAIEYKRRKASKPRSRKAASPRNRSKGSCAKLGAE